MWAATPSGPLGHLPLIALRAGGGILILILGACAPKTETAPQALALDCAEPFDVQAQRLTTQPHLVPAPKSPREPYRFYSTEDGRASYLVTEPGAPAHPAVMMQRVEGGQVVTTGCPYGDKAGYDELHAYLESLKTWRRGG